MLALNGFSTLLVVAAIVSTAAPAASAKIQMEDTSQFIQACIKAEKGETTGLSDELDFYHAGLCDGYILGHFSLLIEDRCKESSGVTPAFSAKRVRAELIRTFQADPSYWSGWTPKGLFMKVLDKLAPKDDNEEACWSLL